MNTSQLKHSPRFALLNTRRRYVLPFVLLLALLAVVCSFLLFASSRTSFAHTSSFETCATALPAQKEHLCTGTDPILGGCTFDAKVVKQQPVLLSGVTVGLVQVRYSPFCHTYWGRGYSYRPATTISVYIADLGTGSDASYLSTSSEVYSNMVYASAPTVTIQIVFSPTRIAHETLVGK